MNVVQLVVAGWRWPMRVITRSTCMLAGTAVALLCDRQRLFSSFFIIHPCAATAVAARLMTRMRTDVQENLSAREIEVLQLVYKGASNREIGKALHISTATVKTHFIHIYGKLGVDDRTAAVTAALEQGILSLER